MLTSCEAPVAFALTRGMARTIGVDLVQAVRCGGYGREDLDTLVSACMRCRQQDRCTTWLGRTVQASQLPTFCPNKAGLEALRL